MASLRDIKVSVALLVDKVRHSSTHSTSPIRATLVTASTAPAYYTPPKSIANLRHRMSTEHRPLAVAVNTTTQCTTEPTALATVSVGTSAQYEGARLIGLQEIAGGPGE